MRARWFLCFGIFYLLSSYASCRKNNAPEISSNAERPEETSSPSLVPVTFDINDAIGGYYQALPEKYTSGNKSYPLLMFLHGGGGFGNGQIDLPLLLNEGIPQLLDEKKFPPELYVKGEHLSFIHLAPQFRRAPSIEEVYSFISYAKDHFRVDSNRIYVAGMSYGGKIACEVASAYPRLFTAIVPMAGVSDTANMVEKCSRLAEANLPIWVFHNDKDQVVDINICSNFIGLLNSFYPKIKPKFTIFSSMGLLGHDAWTRATNPEYKEDNMNIYEWMLQYKHAVD